MRILAACSVIVLATLGCADVLGLDKYGTGGAGGAPATGGTGGSGATSAGGSGGAGATGGTGGTAECVPKVEDCASPVDESCDGAPGCTGAHRWSTIVGSAGDDVIGAVAVDGEGSTIIVGGAAGPIDFGGGLQMNKGKLDMFIAKFKKDGSLAWGHTFGGSADDLVRAVAVDKTTGDIYVSGRCAADGCDGLAPFAASEIVAKFDSAGALQWSWHYGDSNFAIRRVALSDDGKDLAITGVYTNVPIFEGPSGQMVTLPDAGAYYNVLVAKLAADSGDVAWVKGFGDVASGQEGMAVTFTPGGDVVVMADVSGTINFDPGNPGTVLTSVGNFDVAVARLGTNGAHFWSKIMGDAALQQSVQVKAAADGGLVLAASVNGAVAFGDACGTPPGISGDAAVWKLDGNGKCVWVQRPDMPTYQQASGLDLDPAGNVIVSGIYTSQFDFSGGKAPLSSVVPSRYVMKLDPGGQYIWQRGFTASPGVLTAIAADGLGGLSVVGTLNGATDFGGGLLVSTSPHDLVVASLAP